MLGPRNLEVNILRAREGGVIKVARQGQRGTVGPRWRFYIKLQIKPYPIFQSRVMMIGRSRSDRPWEAVLEPD